MLPGIAEILMLANLSVGASAAPAPVANLPAPAVKIDAGAVQSLGGALAQKRFSDNCCNPILCGCGCIA